MRSAQGRSDPATVEQAVARADRVRQREVRAWPNPTLRDYVDYGLRARIDRVAWNFFKDRYDSHRHRARFIAFLTAMTAGQHGRSTALATRFDRVLRTPAPTPGSVTWTVRTWPPDLQRQRAWLADFFADEPTWEPRLRAWAAHED